MANNTNTNANANKYISVIVSFGKNDTTRVFFNKIKKFRTKHILHYLHLKNVNDSQYYLCKIQLTKYDFFLSTFKNFNCDVANDKTQTKSHYNNCNEDLSKIFINNKKCNFVEKEYLASQKCLVLITDYSVFYHCLIIQKMFADCREHYNDANHSIIRLLISNNLPIVNVVANNDISLQQINRLNYLENKIKDLENKIEDFDIYIDDKISNFKSELFSNIIGNINNLITLQIKTEIEKSRDKLNISNNSEDIKKYIDSCILNSMCAKNILS